MSRRFQLPAGVRRCVVAVVAGAALAWIGGTAAQLWRDRMSGALMAAVDRGDVSAIRRLVAEGASPNAHVTRVADDTPFGGTHPGDVRSWPVLEYAAFVGRPAVVQALLCLGADPNARAPDGRTALFMAAGAVDVATVRCLLEAGADPRVRADFGDTAMHDAVRSGRERDAETAQVVALLAARGGDVNAADDQDTVLGLAVFYGSRVTAAELLRLGADPRKQDPHGQTPLEIAMRVGDSRMAALLRAAANRPPPRAAR